MPLDRIPPRGRARTAGRRGQFGGLAHLDQLYLRHGSATAECVEKDRDQVATPARLRAMGCSRIVGRAGAALQLGG